MTVFQPSPSSDTELLGRSPELSTPELSTPSSIHWNARFKEFWRHVVQFISPDYEPKISHRVDRQGRISCWQVYDPTNGQSLSFGSETEVRLWLEHRHYR